MKDKLKIRFPNELWWDEIPYESVLNWYDLQVTFLSETTCFVDIFNSANEKIDIYSPIDFLKKIIEEGKKSISIQRFKGLGEMNPEELWETTLNPENNTLLKVNYSGNDVENETTNPSDRDREIFKILMGEDVVPRKDFINKNAINVNNLDI